VFMGTLYTLCIRYCRLCVFAFLAQVRYGLDVQFQVDQDAILSFLPFFVNLVKRFCFASFFLMNKSLFCIFVEVKK